MGNSNGSTQDLQNSNVGWRFAIPPPNRTLRQFHGEVQLIQPHLGLRVSVLVWNLQKGQAPGFAEAFSQLARTRDLLLLQEVHLRDPNEQLLLFGHTYTMATSFEYVKDGSPTGVAIGCAVQPTRFESQVTSDLEPMVGTPKASLLAEFPLVDGRTLLVATVHAINRAPQAAFEAQIDRLVERLSTHSGPILLAGDFNTQSKGKMAYLEAAASTLKMSTVRFDPDMRTVSKLSRHPLDHAFVKGASGEVSSCWAGGSDHVAMTFDLLIEAAAGASKDL